MGNRDSIARVTNVVLDALAIEGYDPFALGYACVEVWVDGVVVRLDMSVPRKPWLTDPPAAPYTETPDERSQ